MVRHLSGHLACVLIAFLPGPSALAQMGGSRVGLDDDRSAAIPNLPLLEREVAESFIAIDGRAEIRVRPTEIRVVLAVTAEGETAQQCQQQIELTIKQIKEAWDKLQIPDQRVVVDFIAVLPVYAWNLQKRGDLDLGVEERTGFRMQSNLHLAVANDTSAAAALTVAFALGVTDILAFDYWNPDLDDIKGKARELALKAARDKSDVLLGALFTERPPVINVQEQSTVRYPESLYHSFANSLGEDVTPAWRRDVTLLRAYRPRNTYYRGLDGDRDVQPRDLPMQPEISVVSTVRLYFQSPAAHRPRNE